mmetsp:Transcript_6322/g.20486  ORF Transcript_6322/g.20486 Transcript_6322/m.20486 type:complete len:261 (+) Transcript_6322:387-1169(+)
MVGLDGLQGLDRWVHGGQRPHHWEDIGPDLAETHNSPASLHADHPCPLYPGHTTAAALTLSLEVCSRFVLLRYLCQGRWHWPRRQRRSRWHRWHGRSLLGLAAKCRSSLSRQSRGASPPLKFRSRATLLVQRRVASWATLATLAAAALAPAAEVAEVAMVAAAVESLECVGERCSSGAGRDRRSRCGQWWLRWQAQEPHACPGSRTSASGPAPARDLFCRVVERLCGSVTVWPGRSATPRSRSEASSPQSRRARREMFEE